jgi:hypothetical protein
MRYVLLIAGACVGAVAAFAIPMGVVQSATSTIETVGIAAGRIPHDLAALNPIQTAYDVVQRRIRQGNTPEQLGFKPSAVTIKPFVMSAASFDNRRMEDTRIGVQNPSGWHGVPPR